MTDFLCKDCVAREQCGNRNVVLCKSYVKKGLDSVDEMTNEEYYRYHATTRELAEGLLMNTSFSDERYFRGSGAWEDSVDEAIKWLKERYEKP